MKIDMKRLAKLSKLKFSPEEEAKFEKEMEKIVAMVEKLPDIDASGALKMCIRDRSTTAASSTPFMLE